MAAARHRGCFYVNPPPAAQRLNRDVELAREELDAGMANGAMEGLPLWVCHDGDYGAVGQVTRMYTERAPSGDQRYMAEFVVTEPAVNAAVLDGTLYGLSLGHNRDYRPRVEDDLGVVEFRELSLCREPARAGALVSASASAGGHVRAAVTGTVVAGLQPSPLTLADMRRVLQRSGVTRNFSL